MTPDATQLAGLDVVEPEAPSVSPDAPVVIEFKHVTKSYRLYRNDRVRLLGLFNKKIPYETICANKDLSFTIRQGETVALFGHNGAGKSTALKMITGVVFPTEGEVKVEGRVSALLELKAGFDRDLTGRENIALRGNIWGLTDEQIEKITPKVIKFAQLGSYIDQPMRTYSSGMKARLGFAFASSVNPDILIVDEALSVGDKKFRNKCRRRIKRILARSNMTLLFVTHSTSSAAKFCERGIVLEHGQLLFDGPIADAIEFYEGKDALEEAEEIAQEQVDLANGEEEGFVSAAPGAHAMTSPSSLDSVADPKQKPSKAKKKKKKAAAAKAADSAQPKDADEEVAQ